MNKSLPFATILEYWVVFWLLLVDRLSTGAILLEKNMKLPSYNYVCCQEMIGKSSSAGSLAGQTTKVRSTSHRSTSRMDRAVLLATKDQSNHVLMGTRCRGQPDLRW
ncbi:hypothetical protein PVAP13_5KG221207 [Panicum virgatum]|uniref:Uncharacterized protein n=1 Tax=Panicum virgatum TaxID=38727 RepID=A0A8T0SDC3_PANVG|nr:hypothetical protein PVAP13_5KG221207 [Panicum virgatum]